MEIQLTQGKVAIIDEADWPLVKDWKWFAVNWRKPPKNPVWYATGYPVAEPIGNYRRPMHRVIMGVVEDVDHVDGDGLNNRRGNLRPCTKSQNTANGVHRVSQGFKGVMRDEGGRYRASIAHITGSRAIGWFDAAEDAARAYDVAAREKWGVFARLNFPSHGELAAQRSGNVKEFKRRHRPRAWQESA